MFSGFFSVFVCILICSTFSDLNESPNYNSLDNSHTSNKAEPSLSCNEIFHNELEYELREEIEHELRKKFDIQIEEILMEEHQKIHSLERQCTIDLMEKQKSIEILEKRLERMKLKNKYKKKAAVSVLEVVQSSVEKSDINERVLKKYSDNDEDDSPPYCNTCIQQ